MKIQDKVAIVTGAAGGIGAAIAARFVAEGAAGVVFADIDHARAQQLAEAAGERALALRCDVSREADIQALVAATRERFGRVDVYVSNAGILGPMGGLEIDDAVWNRMWQVHAMAHVWAGRAVLPEMVARGEGYFVVTASAAGLLTMVEAAPYAVSKHAAVSLAEWLRIAYGARGVRVSCLCPQGVQTPMLEAGAGSAGLDGLASAEQVAQALLETMARESFLCLPHPQVADYLQRKAQDQDRWLRGMQKMHAQFAGSSAGSSAG